MIFALRSIEGSEPFQATEQAPISKIKNKIKINKTKKSSKLFVVAYVPGPSPEFEANLGYFARLCLKVRERRKIQ